MMPSGRWITHEEARLASQDGVRVLAPWEQDRFKLIALIDMIRFYAGLVIILTRDLSNQTGLLIARIVDGDGDRPLATDYMESTRTDVAKVLGSLLENPHEMPLSPTLRRKVERLLERVNTDEAMTPVQAEVLLKELHNDIITELSTPFFLMIPDQRRWLYEQRQPTFGWEVANQFREAEADIAAASRCIALDEWTAAVFHLMRVLEKGLHALSAELQIPMAAQVEFENWKNIIDQIESKIRQLEQLPKSPVKSETLQRYAQMAINFWYFKESWRNHVSHGRAKYDEREALNVFNHVRIFMQELVAGMTPP